MNYRHIYHAGNFADVMKHLCLMMVIDYLRKKDAPFCAIDAHAGCGRYDLNSLQAQKTFEWRDGIGRFDSPDMPSDFSLFFDGIKPDLKSGFYPGSPLLLSRSLRVQDRLIANELHPDDFETLQSTLRGYQSTRVESKDAYECIRANLPPAEKRGLILIDPPFEKRNEFDVLIRQMGEWKKRFPTGIYMLWYPIKPNLAIDDMKQAAIELGLPRTWCFETLKHPRYQTGCFNGCGLVLFNAPYQIPERIEALLPFLAGAMDLTETPSEWLTQP